MGTAIRTIGKLAAVLAIALILAGVAFQSARASDQSEVNDQVNDFTGACNNIGGKVTKTSSSDGGTVLMECDTKDEHTACTFTTGPSGTHCWSGSQEIVVTPSGFKVKVSTPVNRTTATTIRRR